MRPEQARVRPEEWPRYAPTGRAARYHRAEVREFFGFRECTAADGEGVVGWLAEEVLHHGPDAGRVREAFYERCRFLKIEPPTEGRVERLVASAARRFEDRLCASVFKRVPARRRFSRWRPSWRPAAPRALGTTRPSVTGGAPFWRG